MTWQSPEKLPITALDPEAQMFSSRQERLKGKLRISAAGAILVSRQTDVRWLTGFSGSNGCVLLFADQTLLFTDARYSNQAAEQAPESKVHIVSGPAPDAAAAWLQNTIASSVWLQIDHLTHEAFMRATQLLEGMEIKHESGILARLRCRKAPGEVEAIQKALLITEETFLDVTSWIEEGVSEARVAAEIDYLQRHKGAEGNAFDTIVAFGGHTAQPHARPGTQILQKGMPILMDFGCIVDGYCSDMTRMAYCGEPSARFLHAYDAVNKALMRSTEAAKAGITGKDLDRVARNCLETYRLAEHFSHGLGHGVGLDIHEWPSLSIKNEEVLPSDCIVTIEPGVYLPGDFGIRIENMLILHEDGARSLNSLNTDLIVL